MVRIALLQLQLRNSADESVEQVTKMLNSAVAADSDIVCLPEQWYPRPIGSFEQEFRLLLDAARQNNVIIIAGAFIEKVGDETHISCPVIGRDGNLMGRQLKLHPYAAEKKKVRAGSRVEVFDAGSYKFGMGICHDVVFPEVARALARKDIDLLFFPSRIRKEGVDPWQMYVQVRALENRIPTAAPNACSDVYGGRSIVVDLDYDAESGIALPKSAVASVNEQLLVADIDLESARRIRKLRFDDFRGDLYGSL